MPGVTVEAESPALIGKVRTAVTDDRGLYQIRDLRPGIYAVTFTLGGFSTIRREGIELTAGFTATVSVELRVGALEETITVSGQAPMVDVQNISQQTAITREHIAELPTGRTLQNLATLIPGVNVSFGSSRAGGVAQDVGGSVGETNVRITIHGSFEHDMPLNFDGMSYAVTNGLTARTPYMFNAAAVDEVTVESGILSAQQMTSGIMTNSIPKVGGNRFSGYFLSNYSNDKMQSSNISDEQVKAGFVRQASTAKIYDLSLAVGGPFKQDKLWFHTTFRSWGSVDRPPGAFRDANPLDYVFTPGEPAVSDLPNYSTTLHLTWQPAQRHRVGFHGDVQYKCTCGSNLGSNRAWEAAGRTDWHPELYQGTWNFTASNRLLVEAGVTQANMYWYGSLQEGVSPDTYQAFEISTGTTFRAGQRSLLKGPQTSTKAAVTFVTGAHNFKVGLQTMRGTRRDGCIPHLLLGGVTVFVAV
jgi:hypothetical protein